MLTSKKLKDFALNVAKVDLIGIANIERFKEAPLEMDPLANGVVDQHERTWARASFAVLARRSS